MSTWTAARHPRPHRAPSPGHGGQLRHRVPDRARARPPRRRRDPRRARHRPRRGGAGPDRRRGRRLRARDRGGGAARPRRPGVGARVRRPRWAPARRCDLLVNNAGRHGDPPPRDRRRLRDAARHQPPRSYGPHAAGCCPALARAGSAPTASRVVTVSSNAHKMGRIKLDDLMGAQQYQPWGAYGQSKLANLLFTFELQRRLDAAGLPVGVVRRPPGVRRDQPAGRRAGR